jgi:hypothetical protein
MPRTIHWEIPSETSLFTPLQLQPRALTWLWMSGWARWLRTHWVSFPQQVRDYQTSYVIVGYTLTMGEPLGFTDTDTVEVDLDLWVGGRGRFLESTIQVAGAGRTAARGHWVLMPVRIEEEQSMAAQPMRLRDELLAGLEPDEVVAEKPSNTVPARLAWIAEQSEPIAEYTHSFMVHRHHCEVADQWCFVDIPSLVAESREHMALAQMEQVEPLVAALSSPMTRLDVKLTRPLFAFDQAEVRTTACRSRNGAALYFIHRIVSALGAGLEHGVLIEEFCTEQ